MIVTHGPKWWFKQNQHSRSKVKIGQRAISIHASAWYDSLLMSSILPETMDPHRLVTYTFVTHLNREVLATAQHLTYTVWEHGVAKGRLRDAALNNFIHTQLSTVAWSSMSLHGLLVAMGMVRCASRHTTWFSEGTSYSGPLVYLGIVKS